MEKRFMKALSVIFAAATLFCGCNGNGGGNRDSEQRLDIYVLEQGYGVDWCYNLIDEFKKQDWVKEKYPELEVTFFSNDVREWAFNNITLTKSNKYDIMFGNLSFGTNAFIQIKSAIVHIECAFNIGTIYKR